MQCSLWKSSPVGFLNEQFNKTIDPQNKNSVLGSDTLAQAVIGNIPTVKTYIQSIHCAMLWYVMIVYAVQCFYL